MSPVLATQELVRSPLPRSALSMPVITLTKHPISSRGEMRDYDDGPYYYNGYDEYHDYNRHYGLSAGAIAGIVVGSVVFLLIVLWALWCCCSLGRTKKRTHYPRERKHRTRSVERRTYYVPDRRHHHHHHRYDCCGRDNVENVYIDDTNINIRPAEPTHANHHDRYYYNDPRYKEYYRKYYT
ncbi:hypothetical protein JX266_012271 [Neoarthrinium moseri]|nr:hypothetical protein JX266_012271 [Neoarthrinium moseri]